MKRHLLWVSVAPLALMAIPAMAQVSDTSSTSARTPGNTTAQPASVRKNQKAGQDKAAQQIDSDAAKVETAEDIVVTGYRQSLSSAQAIKRNSDAIVDAIVAQDIGKLPDNTAAESLARVTGIQVSRFSDEVTQVLIRGLPDVATTFNGREIFTAEGRSVALQDFPAGALAGLEVYKSGTANLLEPGLAGLINVRSRRPFDFKEKFVVAGGAHVGYNDQNKKYNPSGNILISQRADTPIGEIGWLINGSYVQTKYRNAVRWGDGYITGPQEAATISPESVGRAWKIPFNVGVYNDSGKRWRPAVTASVQWRPASNFEVYYDFLYQGYRGDIYNDWLRVPLIENAPSYTNVVLRDGRPEQVESLTKTGGFRPEAYRSTRHNYTNTYQAAGGFKWETGRAKLSTDLAWTNSEYGGNEWSFDTAWASPPTADVDFFVDNGISFSLPEFDASAPENYITRGYFESIYYVQGKGWQWRGDLDLDTDIPFLPRIQFGLRWSDRDASLERGNRYAYVENLDISLADTPVGELELTQNAFRGNQGFTSWLMPTRNGIAGYAEDLRKFGYEQLQKLVIANPDDAGYADQLQRFSTPTVQLDPYASFYAQEATYTAYGQAKYAFDIGQVRFDGLLGLRVVNTVGRYSGISRVVFGDITRTEPRETRANYVDLLPNFSLRVRPTDKLQLRFAYTRTRTKPSFGQLNPAFNISQNTATPSDGDTGYDDRFPASLQGRPDAYGSGGNPDLLPLTSKNYDATIEYYFSSTASLTAAFFYHDLYGFIGNYTTRVRDPIYGLLEITAPANAGQGHIKGIEVGGQTFFDFLPGLLSGFGIQANATYLNGENRYPAALYGSTDAATPPPFVTIPGLSKWTYNVALFYEKGDISTRLSMNNRTAFLNNQFLPTDSFYNGEGTESVSRLDFSFNYTPVEAITLTFDITNILATPFNNYRQYAPDLYYPRDIRDEGRYFGLGTRFRF